MEWVSSWIQGIIVAVIISTIIEMILPEGNSKKYIKVVIGVYILFSIISPVITKITKTNFKLSDIFDLNEYIEASNNRSYEDLSKSQTEQIKGIYQTSLKNDIKEKIETKGYKVIDIILEIANDEQYTLKSITLNLAKNNVEEQTSNSPILENNIQTINEVKIQNGSSTKGEEKQETTKEALSSQEQKELKQYLSSVYEIEEKNININ